MTVAVMTRPPAPRLRPGLRRGLMMATSLALHVTVLGSMVLLAADEDRAAEPPLPPIIQLEIERPSLPPQWRPRPQPPEPLRPVEPLVQPQTQPTIPTETDAQEPLPLPVPTPSPVAVPVPAPSRPLPAAQTIPAPAPAPALTPAPTLTVPVPVPVPAPIVAPVAAPPAVPRLQPAPPLTVTESAPSRPAPALPARRPAKDKDEEEAAAGGPPSAPAPRMTMPAPGGAPAPAAGGVTDAWRFAPEGQSGRNARALRLSPSGCPSTGVLTQGERDICDERFNARAAEGAQRPITGSGNAARDARFAREGAREMQRYEAQRRPLSGGVGVVGAVDCPGSNFGNGCAGSHLDSSMQMDSARNVQTRRDGPPASGRPATPGAAAPREPQ